MKYKKSNQKHNSYRRENYFGIKYSLLSKKEEIKAIKNIDLKAFYLIRAINSVDSNIIKNHYLSSPPDRENELNTEYEEKKSFNMKEKIADFKDFINSLEKEEREKVRDKNYFIYFKDKIKDWKVLKDICDSYLESPNDNSLSLDKESYSKVSKERERDKKIITNFRIQLDSALNKLAEKNMRLVLSITRRYLHDGNCLQLSDLMQEGYLGLRRATEKFDLKRGTKFSTYANWWIKQAINRTVANDSRTVRIPVHIQDTYKTYRRERKSLFLKMEDRFDNKLMDENIAAKIGVSPEKLKRALDAHKITISLDREINIGDRTNSLYDFIPDDSEFSKTDSAAINNEIKEKVRAVLNNHLNDSRLEEILRLRYGIGHDDVHTLEEIGNYFGLTRERIRQLEMKALAKLRKNHMGKQLENLI